MNISFREAAFGVKKQIEIDKYVECDACHGHGTADGKEKKTCSACEGRGRVYTRLKILHLAHLKRKQPVRAATAQERKIPIHVEPAVEAVE